MSESGEMKFALGLTTGNFLGPLLTAGGAVTGFLTTVLGLGGAVHQVFAQIDKGGALNDLSKRTGESVQNLFSLQHAFQQSGVSSAAVSPILFQLQRALSGVSETGESTGTAFKALGLDIGALRNMESPEALEKIFKGINNLNANDAAGAISKIFAKGTGADILQLARDSDDFQKSLKEAKEQAVLFGKNAAVFDRLGDTVGSLKLRTTGFFAGLATGAAPVLQALIDRVNNVDFTAMGVRIGDALQIGLQAFKDGSLAQLLELSLKVAFGNAVNFFSDQLQILFTALPGMLVASFQAGLAILQKLGTQANYLLAEAFGPSKAGRALFEFAQEEEKRDAPKAAANFAAARASALAAIRAAQEAHPVNLFDMAGINGQLGEVMNMLRAKIPEGVFAGAGVKGGGLAALSSQKPSQEEADSRTRIGFFSGGIGGGSDYARQTAKNTQVLAPALDRIQVELQIIAKQNAAAAFGNQ